MARIVTVANLKGGVGKTTIAVNVACSLPGRVVLVDADSQASASDWLTEGPVEVMPLPLEAETERDLHAWIARIRATTADYIVIDCPPHLSAATGAAIGLADIVLIPCGPSATDVRATARTVELVRQARKARRGAPRVLVIPNHADRRTTTGKGMTLALAALDEPVGPMLVTRQAHGDATGSGTWIGGYAPGSPAAKEIADVAQAVARAIGKG